MDSELARSLALSLSLVHKNNIVAFQNPLGGNTHDHVIQCHFRIMCSGALFGPRIFEAPTRGRAQLRTIYATGLVS